MAGNRRRDRAHHHPRVQRRGDMWVWVCECGGASCRTLDDCPSWRVAVLAALHHSTSLAA
jgi:hypothetical protein